MKNAKLNSFSIRLALFLLNINRIWLWMKRETAYFFLLRIRGIKSVGKTAEKYQSLIPELKLYSPEAFLRRLCSTALQNGFTNLDRYYDYLSAHPDELSGLKENLTYIGTSFFRGPAWPQLEQVCLSAFGNGKKDRIRIWCAGCSSGKEVYSLLMTILDFVPAEKIELLATDYNREGLRLCEEGAYSLITISQIPQKYRHYIERIPKQRKFRFDSQLRQLVQTRQHDLLEDDYPAGFDIILCRNVIKFFDASHRREVQRKLSDTLNPGGILMVSDDLGREGIRNPESLHLTQIGDSCIYQKAFNS